MANNINIELAINSYMQKLPFGDNFVLRDCQHYAITQILQAYNEGYENVILDAPTGSGKSIIAFIVSQILNEHKLTGYICASDLTLQSQYEKDIEKYNLPIKSVKGIDNYICIKNGLKHSLGNCKLMRYAGDSVKSLDCYNKCPYFMARDGAAITKTSVLNYAYHLLQQNYVSPKTPTPLFKERDFIIYDEAHKLCDIVQNHFAPRLEHALIKHIQTIYNDAYQVEDNIFQYIRIILESKTPKQSMWALTQIYYALCDIIDDLKTMLKRVDRSNANYLSEYELSMLSAADYIKDIHCKVEDFVDIINNTKNEYCVTIINNADISNFSITLKTIAEDKLVRKFLLNKSKFKVYMSATFGNHSNYLNFIGASNNTKIIKLNSTFNFDKSPIYMLSSFDMSFKHKNVNLPKMCKLIDELCNVHSNERGIIHTGNYEFTKYLLNNSTKSSRFVVYLNAAEKESAIKIFKSKHNAILVGPTLLEGIDLPDDLLRFQMFMKVAYPSLADNLIKLKIKHYPEWYNWHTLNQVLQGIGRSVRNENDYAVTYLLDAQFTKLFKSSKLPDDIQKRIILK